MRLEAIEKQKLLESDPVYIAKQKEKALLKKYDINEYLSGASPTELSEILNKLENENIYAMSFLPIVKKIMFLKVGPSPTKI